MEHRDPMPGVPHEPRGLWPLLATVVAVLLTAGVIGGLVYHRLGGRSVSGRAVGSAVVSGVDFSCRLPVLAGAADAFISFPDGAVTIDHLVALNPYKGGYGYTYDQQARSWVPVPGSAVSPDGYF